MNNDNLSTLENTAQQQRYYVNHLAEINNQQTVVSIEDVYSQSGMMLVKKGARITQTIAEHILQHKLIKPLEQQIEIENSLDAKQLYAQFEALFEKFPDVKHIHLALGFEKKFRSLVFDNPINTILLQKLTVFKNRIPDIFEKSIFTAWLCACISQTLKLSNNTVYESFNAGLFHDMGLLHINPSVLNKETQLSPEEWRCIQSHVVIGHLIFKKLDGPSSVTAQAILEHHECCDGTGYPLGKSSDQLSLVGQVVAMADTLQAIRINRFTKTGKNLRDTLPFLHMNRSRHFETVYKAVCQMIMKSDLPIIMDNHYGDYEKLICALVTRIDVLQDAVVVLMLIKELAENVEYSPEYQRFIKVIDPVLSMIRSSGMVRDEIVIWLKKLKLQHDNAVLRDLLDLDLMQMELLWQLKKAVRVINEFLESHPVLTARQRDHLQKLSDYIYGALQVNCKN